MKCPNCQNENSDTAKFCKKCGTALTDGPTTPNSHESMVQSMNNQKAKNNNTKIIIIALVIVAVVLAGAFAYMYTTGNSASGSANHADSASDVDTSDDDEPATASKTSDDSGSSSSSMTIKGGSFSTGSAEEDKTYASINVGKEHAGESVTVQIWYSRDGNTLNNGNMVPAHVHDDGYLYITSADAYHYYPDYATINLYDSNNNKIDSQSVSLSPTSGTQTF